jgi:DNA repair ATPase RecN
VGYKDAVPQEQKDIFSRLADRGEDVIGRISEIPGAQRFAESAAQVKERADELQRRLRGLDALERRVDALERKVDELSKPKRTTARKPAAKKQPAPKPKSSGT